MIGEMAAIGFSLALLVGVPVVSLYNIRMKRALAWRVAAQEIGLTDVARETSFRSAFALTGLLGKRRVRFQTWDRKNAPSGSLVVIQGDSGITLRRENVATALSKAMGEREVEMGDADFDREVYVRGVPAVLRAVLDPETRGALRCLLRGEILDGNATDDSSVDVVDGDVRAMLCDRPFEEPSLFTRAVEVLVALARRLDRPADLVGRIAENTLRERDPRVRVQSILLLASDYPEHAAAREAFRQACQDGNGEVRLRAALALGAEGSDTLLEIATNGAVDESRAARALAGLGKRLPLEHGLEILGAALRRRHIETARACLESLGKVGGESVVVPLVKVLGLEDGPIAVAAARALGASGSDAAETPLLRALSQGSLEVRAAAAEALGHVGSTAAVLPLKEAADSGAADATLRRAARQAVAEIQSRLHGASPGQVSLAEGGTGQVSLAEEDPSGRVTLMKAEP